MISFSGIKWPTGNSYSCPIVQFSSCLAVVLKMSDMELSMSPTASTASEDSLCATALPFTDIMSAVERSSSESSSDVEEHEKQLRQFKQHVEQERIHGEHVPIIFDNRHHMSALVGWLNSWGPFPVHTYLATRIIKDIASALLVLHSVKYSFGSHLAENVYLDKNYHAHLLVEHSLRPGKIPGRFPMEDDMFRLGGILYRLVTGKEAHFNEDELKLEPPPHTVYNIDAVGLKLAHWLLSCHPKNRPTAGGILHHPWSQQKDSRDGHVVSFLL